MGFEMPVDVDYFDHPKTLHLVALVARPEADIYPLRLWKHCAKYAKRGVILGAGPAIEAAVGWRGTPGKLHKALIEVGFIESDGVTVHDWNQGIGRAVLIYERKKQKQRAKYAALHGILPEETRRIPPRGEERLGSGGEGGEEKPGIGDSGGEGGNRPPGPPDQAAPGDDGQTPTREGDPDAQGGVTTDPARTGPNQASTDPFEIDLWAFSAFRTPGKRHKQEAFEDLVRQGVTHERIRQAAVDHHDWDFYEVVKALRNGRGKHGEGRPNPPRQAPQPPRGEVQRQRDEARAAVDAKLAELPADQIATWTRDAEAQALEQKIPESMRKGFVTTILRVRASREFKIEGV